MSRSRIRAPHTSGVVPAWLMLVVALAPGCGNTLDSGSAPADRESLPNTIIDEPVGPGDPADDDGTVAPPTNHPPTAVAHTATTAEGGSFVELDASESNDPDGDALTYNWTQTGINDPVELLDADTAIAGFAAPEVEEDTPFKFTLTVSDGVAEAQAMVTVVVLAQLADMPPVVTANAGQNQQAFSGETVTLRGEADGGGEHEVTFSWAQTSGPHVTLENPSSPEVSFTAPSVEESLELEFELTVWAGGESATDAVVVTVHPVDDEPPPDEDPPPPGDNCPLDPDKTEAGQCGCGVADTDIDGDGTADCNDDCPDDGGKTAPGQCGCGAADTDTDGDGTADCNDGCPTDPTTIDPADCAEPGGASAESDWDLYMLRLVNRARIDPAGEPARIGSAVTDGSAAVDALAYDRDVGATATNHNTWMHDNLDNIATASAPASFSHYETVDGTASGAPATGTVGFTGANPGNRLTTAGFAWDRAGENILTAWSTNHIPVDQTKIDQNHKGWWESAGHRANLLSSNYTVFGHHVESRAFTPPSGNLNAPFDNIHFATQDFARPAGGTKTHIFGLLYNDMDMSGDWTPRPDDHLLREGLAGVDIDVFIAGTSTFVTSETTMDNGAFSVRVGDGTYDLIFTDGILPGGTYTVEDVILAGTNVDAGDHDISSGP